MFKIFEKYPNLISAVSERKDESMRLNSENIKGEIFENRKKFLNELGIKEEDSVGVYLCHGNRIKKVAKKDKGCFFENTDGLIAGEKGIFLSVTVSDCMPIFLFSPKKEIVSIVHCGWKGLENGIIQKVIEKMKNDFLLNFKEVLVGIGPSIGICHYEVGEEVASKFSKYGSEVIKENEGKKFLDIKRIAELQFIENGILKENIEINPECTFCEKEKYFSYRRESYGKISELKAMMAVVGIR